jgi:hypothetical protein
VSGDSVLQLDLGLVQVHLDFLDVIGGVSSEPLAFTAVVEVVRFAAVFEEVLRDFEGEFVSGMIEVDIVSAQLLSFLLQVIVQALFVSQNCFVVLVILVVEACSRSRKNFFLIVVLAQTCHCPMCNFCELLDQVFHFWEKSFFLVDAGQKIQ